MSLTLFRMSSSSYVSSPRTVTARREPKKIESKFIETSGENASQKHDESDLQARVCMLRSSVP